MSRYRISEVAHRTGLPPSTLRYYEDAGVLRPIERTAAGYRTYDDRSVEQLRFVARAKRLRLSLDEISELASLWDADECQPVQHRMAQLVADKADQVDAQIVELNAFARQLREVRQRLSQQAADGRCDDTCGCGPVGLVEFGARSTTIACTLSPDSLDAQLEEWKHLLADVSSRDVIDDGLRLTFATATPEAVASLAAREQSCCSFLRFSLAFDRGRVTLDVSGPTDVMPLINELFGAP